MKLNLKAISEVLSAVKDYLFPYEKISKKFAKINSQDDLINFIKEKLWDEARIFISKNKNKQGIKAPDFFINKNNKKITIGSDNLFIIKNYIEKEEKK